jgi:copper homeostasis protein (lipoprotein)
LLELLLLAVAACGGAAGAGSGGPEDLLGDGEWVLAGAEVDGEPLVVPAGTEVTLQRTPEGQEGQVAGTSGCNRYSTTMTVVGSTVAVRPEIASTMMACAEDVMALEQAYLEALPRVDEGRRERDRLVLSGEGVTLTYEPRA